MSRLGLEVFDTTVQTTNVWLEEIERDLGPDRQVAYRSLKSVLHALRDRLPADEAVHLGAQLPVLVRGVYYDGWRPARQPKLYRDVDSFLEEVGGELTDIRPVNSREAAKSVLGVLDRHISAGEIDDVRASLPEEIRRLWPNRAA